MKTTDKVRVQKLISNFGMFSRREFEKFINSGRVKINGHIAKLGDKATINDKIELDNKILTLKTKYDYYILNKPKGFICSRIDEKGKEAISLIENYKSRNLFTIGRLDVNTTGLIIVTNDGELAEIVNRPYSNKSKEYLVWLEKPIKKNQINILENGITLDDGYKTKPTKKIKIINSKNSNDKKNTLIKMVIFEGKKNQIKRMIDAIDNKVINLKRTRIEGIKLEGLKIGKYKKLNKSEIYGMLNIKYN